MLCGIEFLRVYNFADYRAHDFAFSENKLFANTQDKLFPIFGGLIPELTKKEGGVFSLILIFFLDFAFLVFPGSMF